MKTLTIDSEMLEILYKLAKNQEVTKEEKENFKNNLFQKAIEYAKCICNSENQHDFILNQKLNKFEN